MKLFLCPYCHDVIKCDKEIRYCKCKKSFGYYLDDGLNAKFSQHAVILGFANSSLSHAIIENEKTILNNKKLDLGIRFEAFIIPENSETVSRDI